MRQNGRFKLGDWVTVSPLCPIDFEGVGPVPVDIGRVTAVSETADALQCVGVHFERFSSPWMIPQDYLERIVKANGELASL